LGNQFDAAAISKAFSDVAREKFAMRSKAAVKAAAVIEEPSEPPFCAHPPERLYAWWASADDGRAAAVLCVGCRACGAILQGRAE